MARRKLRVATKGEPLEVSTLLSNPLLIPATLTYINETERFPKYYAVVAEAAKKEADGGGGDLA